MKEQSATRIRAGAWTLPMAGVLFTVGIALRGPGELLFDPLTNPSGWAELVASTNFSIFSFGTLVGMIFFIFGIFTLYAYLVGGPADRWGFAAMVMSVPAFVIFAVLAGSIVFVWPTLASLYLQGQEAIIEVAALSSIALAATFLVTIFAFGGAILYGVAIWRSGTLPKWAGIAFALHQILILQAAIFAVEVLGGVLLIISGGAIAYSISKRRPSS